MIATNQYKLKQLHPTSIENYYDSIVCRKVFLKN